MRFTEKTLKTSFSLPDPFTVGDHDTYEERRSAVMAAGAKTTLTVGFLGALAVVEDWESEVLPSPIKTIAATRKLSGAQMRVVSWVSQTVHLYVTSLLMIPKDLSAPLFSALLRKETTKAE